jgi:neutral trehalase
LEKNNVHCWQGAAYESGLDNSPMYDGIEYDEKTHLMMLADVGLMGLYVEDCRALLEISRILNREEAIEELNARMQAVSQALMTLWNEDDGMFENKNLITGELSPRLSPTNFYALYCPEVTDAQLRAVCDCYFSPTKFHGEYRMPSTPADDPAYHDQDYWRGRVWGPMNYLVYTAFKESGCKAAAKDLAQGSEELFLKEWRLHGHVHENYNAKTGMGCGGSGASDPFYHWGGLLGYIAIDTDQ